MGMVQIDGIAFAEMWVADEACEAGFCGEYQPLQKGLDACPYATTPLT
jgi:hypothetical protein